MRKIFAAAALATVVSTPAMAEPFAGPYVGVEFGLDNHEIQSTDVFTTGDEFDGFSGNGVVGGIYAGFDVPLSSNVFAGVEAKANLSDAKLSYSDGVDDFALKTRESFGASARLGVMVNDGTGLYGRVGWVNTKFKAEVNGFSDTNNDDALALGAGLETRVGESASVRVEYTYADYSEAVKNNSIRAGLSFRF